MIQTASKQRGAEREPLLPVDCADYQWLDRIRMDTLCVERNL